MWMLSLLSLAVSVACLSMVDGWHPEWIHELQKNQDDMLEARDLDSNNPPSKHDFLTEYKSTTISKTKWETYFVVLHETILYCDLLRNFGTKMQLPLVLDNIPNRKQLNWNFRTLDKAMYLFNDMNPNLPFVETVWLAKILKPWSGYTLVSRWGPAIGYYETAIQFIHDNFIQMADVQVQIINDTAQEVTKKALDVFAILSDKTDLLQEITAALPNHEDAKFIRSLLIAINKNMKIIIEFWTDLIDLLQTWAVANQLVAYYGMDVEKQLNPPEVLNATKTNPVDRQNDLIIVENFIRRSMKGSFAAYLFPIKLTNAAMGIVHMYYDQFAMSATDYMKQFQTARNLSLYTDIGTRDARNKMEAIRLYFDNQNWS